jgi:phosphocarrier protein HPr
MTEGDVMAIRERAIVGSRVGLHARPVAVIAQKAASLEAAVRIGREGGDSVDARSPLLLMTLGAGHGDEVVIEVEGPGAGEALAEMVALVEADLDAEA